MKILSILAFVTFPFLFLHCTPLSEKNKGELYMGVVQMDITPPIGYPVHKKPSDGILDPLEVKTIVLQQGNYRMAFIFADLFFMPDFLSNLVRNNVSNKTGIPIENICVAATHTHTDPTCYDELNDYIWKINSNDSHISDTTSYAAQLIDKLINSAIDAHSNLQPVNLQSGIVNIEGISFNRRHLLKNGSVVMNAGFLNPNIVRAVGPVDPEMGILLFSSKEDDIPIASFSTFAMQLATVAESTKFSSDFPHFMEKRLQSQFGDNFISLFGEGPSADVNHWDITRPGPQLGYIEATKPIGERMGEEILQALPALKLENASLAGASTIAKVPLQSYNEMDLDWAKNYSDSTASAILKTRIRKILMLEQLRSIHGETLPMEIQTFRITDNTAIVALPGQFFVELGLAIKEASPFETTIIVTLANSHEDCIPLRKAFPEGSYEIVYSLVESGSGEMMADIAVDLLNKIK